MTDIRNAPLDEDYIQKKIDIEEETGSKVRFLLELIPILLIGGAVAMRYFGNANWTYLLTAGGSLAIAIYLFFSWYVFKVSVFTKWEVVISVVSGIFFSISIGLLISKSLHWYYVDEYIPIFMFTGMGFSAVCILFMLFNIRNNRKSLFYRNILARCLVIVAILLRMYIG